MRTLISVGAFTQPKPAHSPASSERQRQRPPGVVREQQRHTHQQERCRQEPPGRPKTIIFQ